MAQTAVDVVVRVKDLAALDRLKKSLAGIEGATLRGERSIKRFEGSIAKLGRTLAGLAIGDQLRRAFGAAAQFSGTEQRLTNVTKKYQQYIGIQNSAAQAAQKFAISQQQAAADFSSLAARLGSSGATLQDLENIYAGFNTILLENQVSTQEAASAQLQLNQALGAGRLQGEEFRAIAEATPQLLDEVATITGVARGELKEFAADGGVTSQVLIQALTNIKTKGADALADAFDTPAGKLRQFEAAVKDFQVAVGQELLPVITPFIVELTKLLKVFGELPGPVKTAVVGLTAVLAAATLLGPLFGTLAAGAKALGGGLLALGAGGSAAAGALSLTTKALLVLKGAMLALPWVAVAAGLAGLAKITYDYYQRKAELKRLTEGTGVAMNEYQAAINRVSGELTAAEGKLKKMESAGNSNARAINAQKKRVQELKAQLEAIEGTYTARVQVLIDIQEQSKNIAGIDYKADGPGGRLVPINPPKTVSQLKEEAAAKLSSQLPPVGGGSSSGGGGGVARESQVPQLTRELELSNKLLENDRKRLEAQFNNNTAQLNKLAQDRIEIELEGKKAEIAAEEIPAAEKKLKVALAENEAKLQTLELTNQIAESERQRAEALAGVTQPLEDEIELLQAKLNGNEEEIKQLQEIRRLKQSMLDIDPDADTSGVAALVQQRDELKAQAEEADKLKQMYSSLASGIAGEFTSAFKSIIDGTKDVNEAFADMLQGIANQFLDMAMKILQDALTQQLMQLFTSLAGAGAGGFGGAPQLSGIPFSAGGIGYEGGGYTGDAPRSGGLDGKGGFLSVLHPQETVVDHYGDAADAMTGASKAFADSSEAMTMAMATRSANTAAAAEASALETAETYFASGQSTVSFDTYRVGEMDVVTREDAMKIGMDAAKKAEANVYKGLRNMPAVRGRSGVK